MRHTTSNDDQTAAALKELQRIPGIGSSLARDFVDLNIRRVADLRHRNPERLQWWNWQDAKLGTTSPRRRD